MRATLAILLLMILQALLFFCFSTKTGIRLHDKSPKWTPLSFMHLTRFLQRSTPFLASRALSSPLSSNLNLNFSRIASLYSTRMYSNQIGVDVEGCKEALRKADAVCFGKLYDQNLPIITTTTNPCTKTLPHTHLNPPPPTHTPRR